MKTKLSSVLAVVCTLATFAVCASAQTQEVKEKPRMYTYVAFWTVPRTQWADQAKQTASEEKMMEKAIADGVIVGYGDDQTLIHQPDGSTHDTWYSAMSEAALLNQLDQFYKTGMTTTPVEIGATKHWDGMYVSRFYNWHAGSWKGAYSHVSVYKLKADAPNDAVETLSKNLFVPLLEKLLADGAIHEYEIDTEAIHTEDPGTFWLSYIAANSEALDKVNDAVRDAMKSSPMGGPAMNSMIDFTPHRDYLMRTNATYK
jgi:hypothetical protein